MNRKRPRKDISHISKRHLNRLAAEKSKFICDSLLNTNILSDNNYQNPEYLRITSSTINSHNRYETFATENDTIYGQNNISMKCENDEYLELNESDSEQSSASIYRESSQEFSPYIASENANTTKDFTNSLAVWATNHQILHTALRELLERLKQHSCFSTLTLDARSLLQTPRRQEIQPQYTENLFHSEEDDDDHDDKNDNNNDDVNPPIILANNTSSSNLNEQRMENFQKFVIRKLTNLDLKINNISQKLKVINTNQKLILEKLSVSSTLDMEQREIDVFEDLPFKDENTLQLVEEKLKNDSSYRNQMIRQLTRLTCNNLKTSCLQIIKSILANELAEKYSWYGAKKKKIFSNLDICKIIMSVIRKSHENVTDEQIAAPIKIWLAHAKERMERSRNLQQE